MFVLLQRYTFWSNSQPAFKVMYSLIVVCITAKIHFLKQFTTLIGMTAIYPELFVLLQRYTFWSNSQPSPLLKSIQTGCLYYCKDTLFEAIHNSHWYERYLSWLFVLLQRYTFWSNSQQRDNLIKQGKSCLYYCKDTLFEAIHNQHLKWCIP